MSMSVKNQKFIFPENAIVTPLNVISMRQFYAFYELFCYRNNAFPIHEGPEHISMSPPSKHIPHGAYIGCRYTELEILE